MKSRARNLNTFFLNSINPVVKFLIVSDMLLTGAAGMLAPIFALFIDNFIIGSDELVISIAAGLYLVSRSIFQIPIAHLIDRIKGEKDDFAFLVIFSVFIALIPLLYLFISTPLQLYAVQILLGLATAFTYPSYMAIFTRHVDKNREGTEWAMYYTMNDLGTAALAVIGGYLASYYGFHFLIIIIAAISLIGAGLLIPIKPYLYKR